MSTTATAAAEALGRLDQEQAQPQLGAVSAVADGQRIGRHSRLVDATVLSVIVALQVAWLGALAYLAWLLLV